MSDVIDWSKAPEGTTGRGEIGISGFYVWFSDEWYEYVNTNHGGRYYFGDAFTYKKEDIVSVIMRPQPTPWSGEGLPPVGTVCEWFSPVYGWLGGKVVGRDGTVSVIAHNDGYTGCHPHEVRPIRTTEQIAADERDAAVKEMLSLDPYSPTSGQMTSSSFCYALYDAGYRKQ